MTDCLRTDGSTETVDELLITADVRRRDAPSIDEFISRVEGTKVFGMDDVLSHHAERQRQAGMMWRVSEIVYRLQHCLQWVMRVYTSELTPDSVVTYLFHDCEHSLWLSCLVWHVRAIIIVQYTSTDS